MYIVLMRKQTLINHKTIFLYHFEIDGLAKRMVETIEKTFMQMHITKGTYN